MAYNFNFQICASSIAFTRHTLTSSIFVGPHRINWWSNRNICQRDTSFAVWCAFEIHLPWITQTCGVNITGWLDIIWWRVNLAKISVSCFLQNFSPFLITFRFFGEMTMAVEVVYRWNFRTQEPSRYSITPNACIASPKLPTFNFITNFDHYCRYPNSRWHCILSSIHLIHQQR